MSGTGLNTDLSLRVAIDTAAMDWESSPSGSVWRRRLYLDGEVEAGRVTSVVRFEPESVFPAHDHPDGEEIFVLDGVFSDEHGEWPAGTYLLNPEGFRHRPFSTPGCVLFVRLRQHPGLDRVHVAVDTDEIPWQPGRWPGVETKTLYSQPGYPEVVEMQRWTAGATPGLLRYPHGVEIFVLEGSFQDEMGLYRRHNWLRLPAGAEHRPFSAHGAELFVKHA